MSKKKKIMVEVKKHGVHGFAAVEVASYLLKRASNNLAVALHAAANPTKINGKAVW